MSRAPLNLPRLAWRYLWARPMLTALNLMLLSLGLAAVGFVVLVGEQMEQGLKRDLGGIDLVVGATGSPMQILLAGVAARVERGVIDGGVNAASGPREAQHCAPAR